MVLVDFLTKGAKSGEIVHLGNLLPVSLIIDALTISRSQEMLSPGYSRHQRANMSRVLFDIRLNAQLSDDEMSSSLKSLVSMNEQSSLFTRFRQLNPFFRYQQWQAQRFFSSF
jgi:hypothetical protein